MEGVHRNVEDTISCVAVVCPYCRREHGDAFEFSRDDEQLMDCDGCGMTFRHWRVVDVTYRAEPV